MTPEEQYKTEPILYRLEILFYMWLKMLLHNTMLKLKC